MLVPDAHEVGMPHEAASGVEECLAALGIPGTVADVPLPARHDLEGSLAALVVADLVLDGARLTEQVAGLGEQAGDLAARGLGRLPAERLPCRDGAVAGQPLRALGLQPPVALDHRTEWEVELAPPHDIGAVAERADHRRAGALLWIGQCVGDHGDTDPEERGRDLRADEAPPASVVGVHDDRHTCREQFGAGRVDLDARATLLVERHLVVRARRRPVLHLRLSDRGLEVDVPHGGGLAGICLAPGQVSQEAPLRHPPGAVFDGRVGELPGHREPDAPEHLFEGPLVLGGQLVAELDEVATRQRASGVGFGFDLGAGLVRQARVASHAIVVLDPALGGQSVVVPTDREEHLHAKHAPEAGDGVELDVPEDRAEVQRSAHRGRGRVDRVDLRALLRPVEAVGLGGLP